MSLTTTPVADVAPPFVTATYGGPPADLVLAPVLDVIAPFRLPVEDEPPPLPAWDWYRHPNYAETTVATTREAGGSSLVLADAGRFAIAERPIRVVIYAPSGAAVGVYRATAKAGDVLTLAGPIEGTIDAEIPSGYIARNALTGADIDDLQDGWDAMRAVILDLLSENAALKARVSAIETHLGL